MLLRKILYGCNKFWITDKRVGNLKRRILSLLQKRYHFSDWHLIPINERPYAREVVRYVQRYMDKNNRQQVIVEIGCGLGSIIGNISTCGKRIGVDLDSRSIRTARVLHPFIEFMNGSFEDVNLKKIDCLIMVNFIHTIPQEELINKMQILLAKAQIDLIVFDTFKNSRGTEYLYSHKGEDLFGGKYKLHRRSRGFAAAHGARRYIEYWKRI